MFHDASEAQAYGYSDPILMVISVLKTVSVSLYVGYTTEYVTQ